MRAAPSKISWKLPVSHFAPSETKISSGEMSQPRARKSPSAIASRRNG